MPPQSSTVTFHLGPSTRSAYRGGRESSARVESVRRRFLDVRRLSSLDRTYLLVIRWHPLLTCYVMIRNNIQMPNVNSARDGEIPLMNFMIKERQLSVH